MSRKLTQKGVNKMGALLNKYEQSGHVWGDMRADAKNELLNALSDIVAYKRLTQARADAERELDLTRAVIKRCDELLPGLNDKRAKALKRHDEAMQAINDATLRSKKPDAADNKRAHEAALEARGLERDIETITAERYHTEERYALLARFLRLTEVVTVSDMPADIKEALCQVTR